MYSKRTSTDAYDALDYILDNDVYNSDFIYKLDNTEATNEVSTVYGVGRLDLIATTLYGVPKVANMSTMQVVNRLKMQDDTKMLNIKYLTQGQLDNIRLLT